MFLPSFDNPGFLYSAVWQQWFNRGTEKNIFQEPGESLIEGLCMNEKERETREVKGGRVPCNPYEAPRPHSLPSITFFIHEMSSYGIILHSY